MEYVKNIILNLTPDGDIPVVRVKQGDASARFIRVSFVWDSDPVSVGSEQTVLFRMKKPDGTGVLIDSRYEDTELERRLITINADGSVTIELTAQSMSCAGLCLCDICLMSGERVISSTSFVVSVETIPDIASDAVSSDDFRTLVNALAEVGVVSPVYLHSMEDAQLNNITDGDIIVFNGSIQKWINLNPDILGYKKEADVRNIVNGYGFQTESQVNALIEAYVNSLDANETEY